MSLYHAQKGIPESIKNKLPKSTLWLRYSEHAKEARYSDRYGVAPEFDCIDTRAAQVIEVETVGERVEKVVYRVSVDEKLDCCLAVLVWSGKVKTVWMNRKSDLHQTVNLSKYD